MGKRPFKNRLNDLDPKSWIKFQKSWFLHNPPPRRKDVLRHPAKFPETLVQEFIEFFTKRGQVVLDPMAGTGSTLVAALRAGRHCYGIELNPGYAKIARQVVDEERQALAGEADRLTAKVITGDAYEIETLVADHHIPEISYVITSPPYWNMLHARGAETQQERRSSPDLDVVYSDHPNDLGNIEDYEEFLEKLTRIYARLKAYMRQRAYLTIIVEESPNHLVELHQMKKFALDFAVQHNYVEGMSGVFLWDWDSFGEVVWDGINFSMEWSQYSHFERMTGRVSEDGTSIEQLKIRHEFIDSQGQTTWHELEIQNLPFWEDTMPDRFLVEVDDKDVEKYVTYFNSYRTAGYQWNDEARLFVRFLPE